MQTVSLEIKHEIHSEKCSNGNRMVSKGLTWSHIDLKNHSRSS